MQKFEELVPFGSAITWNDVYRFAGNNFIGSKRRRVFEAEHADAGKCLAAMADEIGPGYIPSNQWIALSEHHLEPESFRLAVDAAAKSVNDQRARKNESFEYWQFVFNNCWAVFKEVLN